MKAFSTSPLNQGNASKNHKCYFLFKIPPVRQLCTFQPALLALCLP